MPAFVARMYPVLWGGGQGGELVLGLPLVELS